MAVMRWANFLRILSPSRRSTLGARSKSYAQRIFWATPSFPDDALARAAHADDRVSEVERRSAARIFRSSDINKNATPEGAALRIQQKRYFSVRAVLASVQSQVR